MGLIVERRGRTGAPPLLLVHGWAMHAGIFAPLLARLEDDFDLHLVDLPGHGRSRGSAASLDPERCAELLLAEAPDDALWLGWSMGGLTALAAALAQPRRVRGLVMLCATPRFVRGADWRHGVSPEIFQDFGQGLATDFHGTLERFLALEAFGAEHMKDALRALRAEVFAQGEPAAAALAEGLRVLETCDLRARLPALAVPSLWLSGRRDRLVDPRAMAAAAALVPDANSVRLEHAGHAPFLTHAGEVADHLVDFARALHA
ncbi:pimeloyl-ACP methyl ester esterase BioH [Coralloluteibacterium stylophorae]|uniref:Pimeloyl-[acyl-carrier protein] methyl ester esterase n=1 Tax=Coralloluteibacterium stylophorae TaxID=1776034 RepID=A0A8J8B0B7_9GAMM|nr:pimeloyl-ACP methyl ester esterase BioH [Coralloluteibacterium stylophorae]MBS7457140.1 pimeloyl-ACP methyl ester esterase BioH [Coralloluteibacterium stylophorae]